jgi:hypothetical protein
MPVKIERINNWLTLLGNGGIIISIIFLAYQISEANRVSSAQAYQARAQMGAEITWTLADSDHIGPIMQKVYGGSFPDIDAVDKLNPDEQFRLLMFERAAITLYENNLYQCEQGFLEPEFCEAVRAVVIQRIPYWSRVLRGQIPPAYVRVKRAAMESK